MLELDTILEEATRAVAQNYFLLPIDGGEAIYRERVYCYELYHQLRSRWPADCGYVLNGEVDKRGHQLLANFGANNAVPDFLVHKPGDNSMNHAIIEVKGPNLTYDCCKNDLVKIDRFMSGGVDYDRGIFLIYGRDLAPSLTVISRVFRCESFLNDIEIWVHSTAGGGAIRQTLET